MVPAMSVLVVLSCVSPGQAGRAARAKGRAANPRHDPDTRRQPGRPVDLAGSLRDGKNDEFSDIDITVTVNQDVNDRDFFFALPDLLRPIGGTVPGWGFHALPDQYVATFLFEDFPLFW